MKIYANQLNSHLQKGLSACYMIFGDEPFQINDSREQIKLLAKSTGVEEFIRLTDDDQFDWNELLDHCQALSLFSSKKLIEVELTSTKLAKAASDVLKLVAEQLTSDTTLVLFGGKLDSSQTRTAWFKALDSQGLYIPVYDIDGQHLNRWLQQQLQKHKLQMQPDAQQYLIEFTAGNLLACAQEIEKIVMASNSTFITLDDVKKLVADQSRYTVFQLMDEIWGGRQDKAITILSRLKNEEVEPNIILWALQKDVLLVNELNQAMQFKQDTAEILKTHKVWKNKQNLFINLAQKIPTSALTAAISQLSQMDQVLKFHQHNDPYSLFAHTIMLLTGQLQMAQMPLPVVLEFD
ncbi:MAG: DNA polymerase III subunit delta [Gammaproteobacteria bacterium]|nr:DNA polymerase III subunit delta [Gammaproteobacteria bacterium]